MTGKYRLWIAFCLLAASIAAVAQGCGSSDTPPASNTTHTIYGATS